MPTFNECCPHCTSQLEVYQKFEANDYSTNFSFDCPQCGKGIEVHVRTVPEFELSRKHKEKKCQS